MEVKTQIGINTMKELVDFCGGNSTLVNDWVKETINKEIKTIDELKAYPFKKNFDYILYGEDAEKAPNFRKVFVEYYFKNTDSFSKYEVLDLELALDLLDDLLASGFGGYGIKLKDERVLGVETMEELEELVELVKEEIIKIKFGSMIYDW